jgi:hypothetical protein
LTYSQFLTTGEAMPANLAQNIYESLADLQYNLDHSLIEKPFSGWVKPGLNSVNLTGGATAWETMNSPVQQTTYRMHLGGDGITFDEASVKCGPVQHLEAGELVQLFNLFANRDLSKIDTNERVDGTVGGQTVTMPVDSAQENSIPGKPIDTTTFSAFNDGSNDFYVKNSAQDLSLIQNLNP